MHPKDADGLANSVDPDQTASSEAVWSWSALFAETYLSQYIEFVWYMLLLNYKWHATWNLYNEKVWFSRIYNSFSNKLILCVQFWPFWVQKRLN